MAGKRKKLGRATGSHGQPWAWAMSRVDVSAKAESGSAARRGRVMDVSWTSAHFALRGNGAAYSNDGAKMLQLVRTLKRVGPVRAGAVIVRLV